jgi:hypothetical protein
LQYKGGIRKAYNKKSRNNYIVQSVMGIKISIVAGHDAESSTVTGIGSIEHIISDVERKTFKLNDSELKAAVNTYFGETPNGAWLRSPAPAGKEPDLYETLKCPQVKTILKVESAEILGITSEPIIVKNQKFENNSSIPAEFSVRIHDQITNTSTSTWTTGGELSFAQKIEYGISFFGTGLAGETSMSYTQDWGVGGTYSEASTVGSESSVTVKLEPGQSVVAVLSASRGVMNVRIRYKASLSGDTALNYDPPHGDHHFHGKPINAVMEAADIANRVEYIEDIEIGYYSDARIELRDKPTRRL